MNTQKRRAGNRRVDRGGARRVRHILLDATCITAHGKGMSRYALSLLEAYGRNTDRHRFTVLVRAADLPPLPQAANLEYRRVAPSSTLHWHSVVLPRLVRRVPHDLLHVLGDIGPLRTPRPLVLTATELPWERDRYHRGGSLRDRISRRVTAAWFPYAMRRASAVACISESTRVDVVRTCRVTHDRIIAAPLAVTSFFRPAQSTSEAQNTRRGLGLNTGYALGFITGDGREDAAALLNAFAAARRAGAGQSLIVLGCRSQLSRQDVLRHAAAAGTTDAVRVMGYVDDQLLYALYAAADCYIDASRYEGFGLQPLEAMASGAPVVAFDIPAVREVVGDAGKLVPAGDAVALGAAVTGVLLQEQTRSALRTAGLQRAAQYSWDRTARLTLELYDAVLNA